MPLPANQQEKASSQPATSLYCAHSVTSLSTCAVTWRLSGPLSRIYQRSSSSMQPVTPFAPETGLAGAPQASVHTSSDQIRSAQRQTMGSQKTMIQSPKLSGGKKRKEKQTSPLRACGPFSPQRHEKSRSLFPPFEHKLAPFERVPAVFKRETEPCSTVSAVAEDPGIETRHS